MKFTLDTAKGILIHSCQQGQVVLKVPNEEPGKPPVEDIWSSSLILGHGDRAVNWHALDILQLTREHFELVWQIHPDIVLLGTGQKLNFPDISIREMFGIEGIGLEVMDTGAACRTYNVLTAEGRNVMAYLVVD